MDNLEVYTGLTKQLAKQHDAMMQALTHVNARIVHPNQILTKPNDLLVEENRAMRKRMSEIDAQIDQLVANAKIELETAKVDLELTLEQQATKRSEAKAVADYLRNHSKSAFQTDLEMFATCA